METELVVKRDATLVGEIDLAGYIAAANAINDGRKTTLATSRTLLELGIESDTDYQACLSLSNEAAAVEKSIDATFSTVCDLRHKLWKAATQERANFTAPWCQLKDMLRATAKRWYLAQEAAKREADRQVEMAVHAQRLQLAEKAQDLIDQGFVAQGRDFLNQAEAVVAPVLPEAVPKVAGSRVTEKWKATPMDTLAIARAILAGEFDLMWHVKGVQRPLLVVDQVVLNAIVDRMGKGLKCPGVLVEPDVRFGATRL